MSPYSHITTTHWSLVAAFSEETCAIQNPVLTSALYFIPDDFTAWGPQRHLNFWPPFYKLCTVPICQMLDTLMYFSSSLWLWFILCLSFFSFSNLFMEHSQYCPRLERNEISVYLNPQNHLLRTLISKPWEITSNTEWSQPPPFSKSISVMPLLLNNFSIFFIPLLQLK